MGDTQPKVPPKFKVGDEVILYQPSYRNGQQGSATTTKVIKSGTKYVYVEGPRHFNSEIPFNKQTGQKKINEYGNIYNPSIWVPAEWEAKEHRRTVKDALFEAGVRFDRGSLVEELSTAKLKKLLAVMQEDI